MAVRSSYDTYKAYYMQYTKGGRAAEKILTERQYKKVYDRYRGTGPNVARRIVADQMELSSRQLQVATKAKREALTIDEINKKQKEKIVNVENKELTEAEKTEIKKDVQKRMKAEQQDIRKMSRKEFGNYIKSMREEGYTENEIRKIIGSPKERKIKNG